MKTPSRFPLWLILLTGAVPAFAQSNLLPLADARGLTLHQVVARSVEFKGSAALQLTAPPAATRPTEGAPAATKKAGKTKAETKAKYGEEQFMLWRRSYDVPPPAIDPADEYAQTDDPRYKDVDGLPMTECLKDVVTRMLPYWEQEVIPDLKIGKTVLITAHGNSLRALVKHLDGISDEDIAALNIPTAMPLVYRLDADFAPIVKGGEYLDPVAAAEAAAAVANQGKK